MSQRNRTKLNTRFTIVVLLSMLGQSVSPLTGFPSPSATPIQSAAPVERPQTVTAVQWLLTAPNTLQITAVGFQPDMAQVTAGQVITITNQDTRARTISFSGAALYKVFLPLIRRSGPALANTTELAALAESGDLITLSTGQSVTRTFNLAGNVTVNDAENPTVKATILVTPLPLATEGSLEGIVLDYQTKLPIAGARAKALDTDFEAAADSNGRYRLSLPGGDYTLVVFANGYSFANRKVTVQSYTPTGVDTVELVPLDLSVTPVGGAGGVATNSIGNTNVVVASGAVTSTKAMRLTWLPVNAQTDDFSALPGPFTDGNMPIGFVMFEPDGTQFSAPITWTIEYTGDLPVGMLVPCYYWIESEARWGDPVDGRVVDLGNSKKGLRAVLPHFSSYGFAPPPPPIPDPPQNPPEAPVDPTEPSGPEDNPEGPNNNCDTGSQINLMSGELCQTVGTLSLPTVGALPTQITAKYHSLNATSTRVISTAFGPASGQLTPDATWTFYIAGRTFSGTGKQPYIEWDGRDANGVLLPPGAHAGTLTAYWAYDYGYMNCSFPTPPNCRQVHMISRFASSTPWFVQVRRNDLSPWGLGWFGPHDMLLVDRGDTVSFVQGNGRQVSFAHEISGTYRSPKSDFSVLAKQPGGDWTRTFKDGSVFTFNADGRLTRIADRYGNAQVILYESNGKTIPAGGWGLTTRIRRVLDSSGNQWDYAYDANGWLAGITDSAGRVLRLTHDASGRLTGVTDPLNQTETFTYDANGLMTGHTDRRGFTTNYVLDARGRVMTRAWPTGTSLQMSYDPSQVSMLTDRGTPLVTTLDDNYSPIQRYNGVYTMTTTYNSDLLPASQDTPPQQMLYDAQGNVINMFTARHTAFDYAGPYQQVSRRVASDGVDTRFERDGAGNLTRVTDALGQSYQMSYDTQGQLLSITDPLGHITSFERDARGQVTHVTDPLNRVFEFTYDAAGNRIASRDPLSRTTGLEYDALSHLTAVVDALNGRASITYDANGNVTRIVDQTARPITYAYDALNRVTGVTYADGGTNAYTYDGSGNVIGMADARGLTRTYTYDAAGRLTQRQVQGGPTTAYAYDRYDQLTSAADGVISRTTSYVNDTVDYPLRVQQQSASLPISATVDYQYSNGQVRPAGTVPLAAASAQAPVSGNVPQTESGVVGAQSPVSVGDVPQTESGSLVPNAPTSVVPRAASFSEPETLAQDAAALPPLWPAAPAAVTCASIANGNWSNPAIWSCGAVPTDTAVIDGEQVTVDVSPTLRSLVFESGALGGSGVHTIDVTETLVFTTSALKSVNGSLQINNAGTGLWTGGDIGGNGGPVLNNLAGAVFDISAEGVSMSVSGGGVSVPVAFHLPPPDGRGAGACTERSECGEVSFRLGAYDPRYPLTSEFSAFAAPSANCTWNNASGGNWGDAANWISCGGGVPGAADNAFITLDGTYTVTLNVDATVASLTVGGASGTQTFAMTAGRTLTLNGASTFDSNSVLNLSSSTLTGSGDVTMNGTMDWSGGTITGTGAFIVNSPLNISGTGTKYLDGRTLTNKGTANLTGTGHVSMQNAAVFDNQAGATLDLQVDSTYGFYNAGGSGTRSVNNAGTITKSGGTGNFPIAVALNNTGTVNVNSGALNLNDGGTSSGSFTASAGTTLNFGGGTHTITLGTTASISGAGTVGFSGGTTTIDGTGAYTVTGTTLVNGGTVNSNINATMQNLNITNGMLGGSGPVTVNGTMNWSGGGISGTGAFTVNSPLNISGTGTKYLDGRTLTNKGTANLTGTGHVSMQNAAVFDNQAGATLDLQVDSTYGFYNAGGSGTRSVNNAGTITKSGGTGNFPIAVALNNTGTVNVNSGALNLNDGGTSSGSFTASAGTTLNFGGGTHTITLGTTASISGAGTVGFSGGTTTIDGTGAYTVTGTTLVNGGTVNSNINATMQNLNITNGMLGGSGPVTVNGTMNWSGGGISGTGAFTVNSPLNISGTGTKYLDGRTLTNKGTANLTGTGHVSMQNAAVFDNQAGATLDLQVDSTYGFYNAGGSGTRSVNNAGTITKSGGTGNFPIAVALNNTGTVNVNSGALNLNDGGTSSGSFTASAGTTLNFGGGTHTITLGTTASISGAGTVGFSGGTTTIDGTGAYTVTGTTLVNGGTVNSNINATMQNLNITNGMLGGSGPVTVNGTMNWSGGGISGTGAFTVNSPLNISGTGTKYLDGRTLTNKGTANLTGTGHVSMQNAAVFDNQAGATLDLQVDSTYGFYNAGGSGTRSVNNAGTITKSGGTGNFPIAVALNNTGTVNVNSGALNLNDGGTSSGSFTASAGTTLNFGGGTHTITLGTTASISGAGTVGFSGGTTTIDGTGAYTVTGTTLVNGGTVNSNINATMQNLNITNGMLGGSGPVTVNGTMNWSGGGISGTGAFTVNSPLNISGTGTKYLDGRTLTNKGTANLTGTGHVSMQNAAVFDNQAGATLDLQVDSTYGFYNAGGSGTRSVNNAGTITKSGGTGNFPIAVALNNTGVVEVWTGALQLWQYRQTAGATRLAGGDLSAGGGSAPSFIGGVLTGAGTIWGNVSNVGATIAPGQSPGAITIQGNYTQGPTGTLAIEVGGLAAGTQHDALNVSGSATLNGALNVTLINGFEPNRATNRIQFMTYASRSGVFAQVINPISATHPVDYHSAGAALGLPLPGFVLPGDARLSGVSLTSNDNRAQTLGLTHDAIGRLTTLRSAGYSTYTLAYAYDPASRLTARQASAGSVLASSYAYHTAGQLMRIAISDTNALTQLLRLDYAYDAAGNITGITSSRDGAASYTYDALNRLTGVSSPGLNAGYGYDAAGNRTSVDGVTFTYDAGGRLVNSSDGASYAYDAAGNLLTRTRGGQTDTFVWDGLGRLMRIDYADATFSEYRYDSAGQRISQRGRDGTTIYYTYLGHNLAQELDSSGAVIASYTYDGLDRPVSMYRSGLTYFYLLDHLGSVLGLVDESGVMTTTYRYDPWGNVISSTGSVTNPLRFTAREWDEESRLYFYRARYYDPQVGRFISRDPIGVRGGINLYAYVENDPTNRIDPSGLGGSNDDGGDGDGGTSCDKSKRRCPRDSMDLYDEYVKSEQWFNGSVPGERGEGANALSYQIMAILEQLGLKDCPQF